MGMDIYQEVTDRIIEELNSGKIPWRQPWSGGRAAISHMTGKPYSLMNQMLLGAESGEYITFHQAQKEGGHVKKGEKGRKIVWWNIVQKKKKDEKTGTEDKEVYPCLKVFTVFNINQCEGIEPKFNIHNDDIQPDEQAEKIVNEYVNKSGVTLNICCSDRAFYRPSDDSVTVPQMSQYADSAEYYSTLFHELTHSTGHESRLNRLTDVSMFGSETYSKEELVAELGSAFLCNTAHIDTQASLHNSAAYIQGWLRELKNDKRLIVSAASKAEKATDYILGKKEDEANEQTDDIAV